MAELKRDIQNLVVFAGDDVRLLCTVKDDTGALVDVSGALEIRWALAATAGGAALIEKTLGSGVAKGAPTQFYIDVDSADTATLTNTVYWPQLRGATYDEIDRLSIANSYYHECTVTAADGKKYTVMSGRWFSRAVIPPTSP